MEFYLFVDSSHSLTLNPETNYKEGGKKVEDRHRVRNGAEYVYKWGDYDAWKFGVRYVNSEFKATVNSWWNTNTDLLFKSSESTQVHSVRLTNGDLPIGEYETPYTDKFAGTIELETY